jgi:hypothetical protein
VVKPLAARPMKLRVSICRVNQDIGVDGEH